jgi:hypothetical protein
MHERPWLVKITMSKKRNARVITISDFKLYYRAIAMKTAYYWQKSRPEIQWNRIEDPNLNPSSYAHLIFDKVAQNTMEKRSLSTNVMGYLHAENSK